jgi:hypothetical protein
MEWSVHIRGASDLDGDLGLERFARVDPWTPIVPEAARLANGARLTHAAFGTEFCEHLIPSVESLEGARDAARARGLGFTLLTPYVSNAGLARLRELFRLLLEAEVVFNDWGVLNVLRREFPHLRPIQGRLLFKSLRDPRIMGVYAEAPAQPSSLAALQGSNLDNESYTRFLSQLGVAGVELDSLPQGMDLGFAGRGLGVAVWFPFGFVATARVCMAAGLHYRKPDKFQPGAPCRHECQTHLVRYTYTNSPFQNRDQQFYLRGNTYFYAHTAPMLRALLDHAAAGRVSRLIFEPRLPMVLS